MSPNKPDMYLGNCCENSFILVDLRNSEMERTEKVLFAKEMIPRFDVDSALFLTTSKIADIHVEIFEQDGSQSDACGNGMLLISHLLNIGSGVIETKAGIFNFRCTDEKVSVILKLRNVKVEGVPRDHHFLFVRSGEPHLVAIVDNIQDIDLTKMGEDLQKDYRDGINVNIIQKVNDSKYFIKTYERGLFDITQSCGTGTLSSYTAVKFFTDKKQAEVVEFVSTGGTHWVSEKDGGLELETLRKFCKIIPLNNIT